MELLVIPRIVIHIWYEESFAGFNHFEVELIDSFDESRPPPAIALCTASPYDPAPKTNFRQDFIRFWATGEGMVIIWTTTTTVVYYNN